MRFPSKFLALAAATLTLAVLPGCGVDGGDPGGPTDPDGNPSTPPPDDNESRRTGEDLKSLESRWQRAATTKTTGVSATLDFSGKSLYLSTSSQAQLDAPGVLVPGPIFPDNKRYVFFADAQVGSETGLLVLEGTQIQFTAGTLGKVDMQQAVAHTHLPDGTPSSAVEVTTDQRGSFSDPQVTFPQDWSGADKALFFSNHAVIHASNLTLTGFTRGLLVTSTGSTPISGSVTVTSSSRMYWDSTSHADVMSVAVQSPAFALGGVVEGGSLTVSGQQPVSPPPSMVKGRQALVTLRPGSAKSEGSFTLTQAVTEQGMLLASHVELAYDTQAVTVKKTDRALIPVVFREKGLQGDAVLTDLQVTGSGKDAVSLPLGRVETYVEHLWNGVADMGYMAPFLAIPLMPLTPFIALGEALLCLFTTCPEAYPVWMEAGKVDRFHIIVQGTKLPPGTYEATVTLTGRNYATFNIPVQFTITE